MTDLQKFVLIFVIAYAMGRFTLKMIINSCEIKEDENLFLDGKEWRLKNGRWIP